MDQVAVDALPHHAILAPMYALTHDLARRRILYSRPLPTLPDVLLIDVPRRFAHASLSLGRYYPILVETEAELAEIEAFIASPRRAPVQPDLLDRRVTSLIARRITFAAYAPPDLGWPHLLVCHWPASYVALASDADLFARGGYTTEMFDTPEQLAEASTNLIAVLGKDSAVTITLISPADQLQGHA